MGLNRGQLPRGLAVALVGLLVLGSGELLARARTAKRMAAAASTPGLCTEADALLHYTYVAGRCGNNSRGWPDLEPREAPKRRIAVVGDSVAAGDGVERSERFTDLLEDDLGVEVLTLARSGYSTSQELLAVQDDLPALHPDLILWSYVLNDPAHPIYDLSNALLAETLAPPVSHLARFLAQRRYFLRFRGCGEEYHRRLHCGLWAEVEANLQRIAALQETVGAPVVLVLHPVFVDGLAFDAYPLADVHGRLTEAAERVGLTVLDLLGPFRDARSSELGQRGRPGWFDPWHPSALGHRVTADAVAAYVWDQGLISEP